MTESEIIQRAQRGEEGALGELFVKHRERLRRMIHMRLDRRLSGRVDASDVLQDAYLEAERSFPKYLVKPDAPFYLWIRCIAGRTLMDAHRRHLSTQARDARREVSIFHKAVPDATSEAIAAQLLGQLTSPSEAAIRAERRARIQDALNAMNPLDREVLVLRHFEQMSNVETAQVLDIAPAAASKRHLRALKRLKEILRENFSQT